MDLRCFQGEGIIRLIGRMIFSLAFLFLMVTELRAQTYYFDNYSVPDGLAQSKVFTVIQDVNDYLWLGTGIGVSRFDGVEFENFTSEDGIAINGVRAICEDSKGVLWMGHTGGGLSRYNGMNFENLEFTKVLFNSDVTSITEGPDSTLWITTASDGALNIWNPDAAAEEIKYEQFKGKRLSDRVFGSYLGSDGTMYFITDVGVQRISPGAKDFENFFIEGMGYFQITSIWEDSKGNFWFGTYNDGLYKFDAEIKKLRFYSSRDGLGDNFVSTLFEDSRGAVWVGTWGGGISRIDDEGLITFDTDNGLQDQKIWCIGEDVEGNILLGTNENGLSIFKGEKFVSFTENDGLINNQIWSVLEDKSGRFWVGTNGGITMYDPDAPKGKEFKHLTEDKYSIDNQIRFLKEDRSGNIWIGTYGNGTFEYNPRTDRFSYNFLINSYNTQLIVTAMEIDRDNNLWVGTTDGLIYYNIDSKQVQFLTQVHGLAGTDISALYSDSGGTLWVGSLGKGITTIEGDTAIHLELEDNFTPTCFMEDQEGNIWVGTEGQGLMTIRDRKVVKHFTRETGLLANLITLVNVDKKGNVYIGTNQGLNKYVPGEDKIYTYMEKNGFTGIETKNNASFRDKDGMLWFGTVDGVMRYDPEKDVPLKIDPLTHIIRMRVNLEDRIMTAGMKLRHSENSIIFDYTSICLTNPDAVLYQVKLEGADIDWLPPTHQASVTYPALPPGKFTFRVKARNSDGIWNENPISFAFQIRPPFYFTWWFILICSGFAVVGIFAYIKIREKQLKRENRILEEKVRMRTATVVAQKEELAEKNKDIMDSITYAKRIQFAILPPEIPFKDTFIMFKPKDIVSGDFYWLLEKDGLEFIAAVDCTGHGVPGAFMSIIGHSMLNKIVIEYGITKPSEILQQLDVEVGKTLHTGGEGELVKDGMDMSLVCFDKKKSMLQFSGAYNPIYIFSKGELSEAKADRFPIGRSDSHLEKVFTNHEISIGKGDAIYMFSDGYADQFGGPGGKKFKSKPLKDMLLSLQDKSMEDQHNILDRTFEEWRGEIEQIDDVLVIGRRF